MNTEQPPPTIQSHISTRHETLMHAAYYAPRGRPRLYLVASQLAGRYLYASDLAIGIIGAEGSGKSTLIRGLFPGLELTNDDDGVNIRSNPIFGFDVKDFYAPHTYHIDVRYEAAFRQKFEIAEAITRAVSHGRRVVIEHFDQVYEALGYNAQILFAIGEAIIVARPSVFGPFPERLREITERSIRYRLMAHSAEDITMRILERDYHYQSHYQHSDVKHGFVIVFPEKPTLDIAELEAKVKEVINKDVPIRACGDDHISIGGELLQCTGWRTHVPSSAMIENFRLAREFVYHPVFKEYLLVGRVGTRDTEAIEDPIMVSQSLHEETE